MNQYIVGIDAGGTKTRAALYDVHGRILRTAVSGFGNMLVDAAIAKNNIVNAISDCLAGCPTADAALYIGAAGITADGNAAELALEIKSRFPGCPCRIESDAIMALYAMTEGRDGILAIAGTGSIAYAKRGATLTRAGGWGNILGDEGSGYDIARRALAHITTEYDAGKGYGLLSRRLLEKLGTDVYGLVKMVHTVSKGEIAGFFPIVDQAAADGDPFASALLQQAGQSLAAMVGQLRIRAEFAGQTLLAVKGGVLEKSEAVKTSFINGLDEGCFSVSNKRVASEWGAYYMHMGENPPGGYSPV